MRLPRAARLAGEQVSALAAALFACGDHKHETRRLLKARRKIDSRADKSRDSAFHVGAAPPIILLSAISPPNGATGPRARERDDVGMPREAERKLGSVSTGPCDQIVPIFVQRHIAGLEASGFQELAEMAGARSFIAGRIDRLKPDEFLRQLGGGDHGAAKRFSMALALVLVKIAIIVKGFRVGERLLVLGLIATHDFTQNARLSEIV